MKARQVDNKAIRAANRADKVALFVGFGTLATAFFPLPEWVYVASIVANLGAAVYLLIAWHLAAPQHPINQLAANPAEGEHISPDANDGHDVRRGVPD